MIRRILNKCFLCRKNRAKPLSQLMADLPKARQQSFKPPFTCTGIDYFGPMYTKVKRSHVKRWGCIFTCMSSRAIHLELVEGLDASSFINCLRRFLARRPYPNHIWSDNGSNFCAASKELQEALQNWNSAASQELIQKGIQWHFNPPAASHQGGVWERLIRSVRQILTSTVGESTLTDFELMTFLSEAESIVNSRPLTANSDDPRDFEALTPNHLLLQSSHLNLPPDQFDKDDNYHRQGWRRIQYLANQFWTRWTREYLTSLQERSKWNTKQRNLAVGDIILLKEDTPRCKWRLGRVTEVFPGKDGLIRSARIKTRDSSYVRPITKMCLLEQEQ